MIVLSLFRGLIEVAAPSSDDAVGPGGSMALADHVRDAAVAEAAALCKVRPSEIFPGRGRERYIIHARQLAYYLLREKRRADGSRAYSLTVIARSLGLDHTTVRWGIRSHLARRANEAAALRQWRSA